MPSLPIDGVTGKIRNGCVYCFMWQFCCLVVSRGLFSFAAFCQTSNYQYDTSRCEVCAITLKYGLLGGHVRDSCYTGGNLFPLV